jgi:hypothetical protein
MNRNTTHSDFHVSKCGCTSAVCKMTARHAVEVTQDKVDASITSAQARNIKFTHTCTVVTSNEYVMI